MTIRKYIHSCLVVEEGGGKLLFDPGIFSFIEGNIKPEDFTDITGIIITHEHQDHVDMPALKIILAQNPGAKVLANAAVAAILEKESIPVVVMDTNEEVFGSFTIKAIPAAHEKLLVPVPDNTAYLINNIFLHPGDSLSPMLHSLKNIKVLALPVTAPWATQVSVGEFAQAVKPEIAIPIHDGYVKDFFLRRQYKLYESYLAERGITFRSLETYVQPSSFVSIDY